MLDVSRIRLVNVEVLKVRSEYDLRSEQCDAHGHRIGRSTLLRRKT